MNRINCLVYKMSATSTDILPLYHFFERLRQNEFPLGIDDYENFLYAAKHLVGIAPQNYRQYMQLQKAEQTDASVDLFPKEKLFQLCRLLWLKPNQSVRLFEDLFEENYKKDFDGVIEEVTSVPEETAAKPPGETTTPSIEHQKEEPKVLPKAEQETSSPVTQTDRADTGKEKPVFVRIGVSERQENSLLGLDAVAQETEKSKFLFTEHYYPIDLRKVQQNLRTLPAYGINQPSQEIDIERTIDRIIEQGYFNGAVLQQQRKPSSQMLLLIDHQGSMIAFSQLAQDIRREFRSVFMPGKNEQVKSMNAYYFYNAMDGNLFENTAYTKFTSFQKVLNNLRGRSTYVIIISDAGAARGRNDSPRVNNTKETLRELRNHTQKIVWLNPLPAHRWVQTSAGEIAKAVAMFEANENGIKNATDVLKGSSGKLIQIR